MKINKNIKTVPEYIAGFPAPVQSKLKKIRSIVRKCAPEAIEKIGYGMPAYSYQGMLLYFAAYKAHIGFYAMPSSIIKFEKQLSKYETSKGAIRFPLDKPLPEALLAKIVKFRVKENIEKKKRKKNEPKIFR